MTALLLTAVIAVLCCACGQEKAPEVRENTSDMLKITSDSEDYSGCLSRFRSVSDPVKNVIVILEEINNDNLRTEDEKKYFLNENYITTLFDLFDFERLELTASMDNSEKEYVPDEAVQAESAGMGVLYENGKDISTLKFVSEEYSEVMTAEYNKQHDSMRYIYYTETAEGKNVKEFLEFTKTDDGMYIIQTRNVRACVSFGENLRIDYFCCSELKEDDYSSSASVYPDPKMTAAEAKVWVVELNKDRYSRIYSFSNGIFTHEDCTAGPWKTVEINSADYASAFYM